VIYTSGSTGLPKGVMIDHQGAVNTILDINQRFEVKADDRVLALSSLGFDLSVYDIFGILAAGGTIVIPEATAQRDPAQWAALMAQEQVTIWNSVPALMEMLVEYLEGHSGHLPESLRLVLLSGDWIPVTLPDRIKALGEGIEVISLGGATEASIWSILSPIEEVEPGWKSIPYGKPMLNQRFHVFDGALEPRPVWVPGQLYIGGIGVAQGYWRDKEKTRISFITHPRTGERLYRTGDLGRYFPDGNIEFLGREDFQVKIQGYRIELGEIETVLTQHPMVQTGVVTAVGDPRGNKRLVAYVVPDQKFTSDLTEPQDITDTQIPPDYEPPHAEGMILDPLERLKFKLTHPELRREEGTRSSIQLTTPEVDDGFIATYVARRSYRSFASKPIPFDQFSQFLSCLWRVELEGAPFPKSWYGSAGSLYPVQTYLYIKPDRVKHLAGGTYYYHPQEHRLLLLSAEAQLDRTLYPPGNREIFDGAAFVLFLIGQLDAITPMYGEHARDFCLLEAGLITQLLEMSASTFQIGLCQIGGFDFAPIRHWFALEESHLYLHSLLGGHITPNQNQFQAFIEELDELRSLLGLLQEESQQEKENRFVSVKHPGKPLSFACFQESNFEEVLIEELRTFLRGKLPEYMVPATFVLLEALPLTPNGKVDRKALPEPKTLAKKMEKTNIAPQNDLERAIATMWQEMLQIEQQIGIHDNFFELGGDSLLAVQIISRMRKTFEIDFPLTNLFEQPTVAALARYIEINRWKTQTPFAETDQDDREEFEI
jgi:SagB-type dehydrogenase family enzyme